jgi:uncharacterized protein
MTAAPSPRPAPALPSRAGIGLCAEHFTEFTARRPSVAFVEVHSENHFARGGRPWHHLVQARRDRPVSLHGVGLSIGSVDPLDDDHLDRLHALVRAIEPALVSEHLCWSSLGGVHTHDLLPLPFTDEAVAHVVQRVQRVQERLRRRILLENVSSYFQYADAAMPEWAFVGEVCRRSGCGLLLDVNNVFVSAHNHGFDALAYLHALPADAVQEIHLAGFTRRMLDEQDAEILIDTHDAPVADEVWSLYAAAIDRFGPVATLIEWDTGLPALDVLLAEAAKADTILEARRACAA